MAHYVTVRLLLDTEDDAASCDAVNEILREQQRKWVPGSALIDYVVGVPEPASSGIGRMIALNLYEEGDMA